jgi:hypothetical protein
MRPNRIRIRLALVAGVALGVSACGDDGDDTTAADAADSTETDGECSTPVVLELTNTTSNAIEVIHFLACDMSDGSDYPVPRRGSLAARPRASRFPDRGAGC